MKGAEATKKGVPGRPDRRLTSCQVRSARPIPDARRLGWLIRSSPMNRNEPSPPRQLVINNIINHLLILDSSSAMKLGQYPR